MLAAAAHLRSGRTDIAQIADLTGVPAALIELMEQTATPGVDPPSGITHAAARRAARPIDRSRRRRLLLGAAVLSVLAIGSSAAALACHQPVVGQLGAVAALLALLGCHLAARRRRRR